MSDLDRRGGASARREVDSDWGHLFGALPREAIEVGWWDGCVRHAAFGDLAARLHWELGLITARSFGRLPARISGAGEILRLPAMRGLTGLLLTASRRVTVDGLDALPVLENAELYCESDGSLAPLAQGCFRALRFLRIQLQATPGAALAAGLLGMQAPALRELWIGVDSGAELGTSIDALAGRLDIEQLERLKLEMLTPRDARRVIELSGAFARLGSRLELFASDEAIAQYRQQLRAAVPRARLCPVLPVHFSFSRAPPSAHQAPRWGTLESVRDGRGMPFDAEHGLVGRFSRCMWCAGAETRCVYYSSKREMGRWESYVVRQGEYLCRECGLFTCWSYCDDCD